MGDELEVVGPHVAPPCEAKWGGNNQPRQSGASGEGVWRAERKMRALGTRRRPGCGLLLPSRKMQSCRSGGFAGVCHTIPAGPAAIYISRARHPSIGLVAAEEGAAGRLLSSAVQRPRRGRRMGGGGGGGGRGEDGVVRRRDWLGSGGFQ